jgi:hypothetical protein
MPPPPVQNQLESLRKGFALSQSVRFFLLIAAAPFLLLWCAPGLTQLALGAPHKPALHRVDMIVSGSSCATCLIRLEKKLKAEKGVVKVVVSILRPFKSVVIYDSGVTNWTTINKVLEGEKVTATGLKDTTIAEIPLVLDPK